MMSAMPAYAIRRARDKKKSKIKHPPGRGIYQLRPARPSRCSISSTKGVYKRPQFHRASHDAMGSDRESLDRIRRMEKRRRLPLYYVGTALMCSGLVLVFVSVAINDRTSKGAIAPVRYFGLGFLALGGLCCLIKVLCFSEEDANNVVFIHRTEDHESNDKVPSEVSSIANGPVVLPAATISTQSETMIGTKFSYRNSSLTAYQTQPRHLSMPNIAVDEDCGGAVGGAPEINSFQMNGLSIPSSGCMSSNGNSAAYASSTHVLITPESVSSAKF
ncbi:Uncharacterised protein r2_g47 [Pycnogonum litorale]